jgi:predicted acylesterase/phospholipase RssA
MTIKHLVISGGGPMGFQFIGALQYLNEKQFWKIEDIQSIYATSIGSIIAVFLSLKYDWETINKYIIERPWHEIFTLSGKQILEAYYNKGLYGKKIFELILKPILEAKDLSLSVTLKELYEFTNIDLHIFTFELNSFKIVQLNYKSNPDLLLIDAIYMSSSIPGIFMPKCLNNECYIDGALMANYPLSFCLENGIEIEDEILGIRYSYITDEKIQSENMNDINEDSSILDFIMGFSSKAINFINTLIKLKKIKYEINFELQESPLSLNYVKNTIKSVEMRRECLHNGYVKAQEFLEILQNGQDLLNKLG